MTITKLIIVLKFTDEDETSAINPTKYCIKNTNKMEPHETPKKYFRIVTKDSLFLFMECIVPLSS